MTTMRRYAVSHLGLHKILGTTVTMIMMISSSENAIIVEDDHIFLSYIRRIQLIVIANVPDRINEWIALFACYVTSLLCMTDDRTLYCSC